LVSVIFPHTDWSRRLGSVASDYQRVSFLSDVVDELSLSSEVSVFGPHFLLVPRQITFAFLFPAIPTPLWFIEAES